MQVDPNYYAILGLEPGSSLEQVKDHYRRLAKIFHPDLNNNDEWCQEQIKELNLAYEYLLNPARKAAYDARFRAAFGQVHTSSPGAGRQRTPPVAPEESPQPHPTPPGLRPIRFVSANGGSVVVSPRVILTVACCPLVIGLFLFLGTTTSFLGVGGDHAVSASSDRALIVQKGARVPAFPVLPAAAPSQKAGSPTVPAPTIPAAGGDEPGRAADPALPLLERCAAVLPKADAVIATGNIAYGANEDFLAGPRGAESSRRCAAVLRLAGDLNAAKTQRDLIYADIERLRWVQSPQEMQRVTPPAANDLRRLTAALGPVQADVHALKAASAMSPITVAVAPAPVVIPPAAARHASAPKTPFNPHLSSPGTEEPQFAMPAEAGSSSAGK